MSDHRRPDLGHIPLSLLIALGVGAHLGYHSSRVAVSLLALHQAASAAVLGLLMSLYAVLPMLLALRAGRLIDRIGPRRPMLAGNALILAGNVLPAAFSDQAVLYLSCVLVGVGFMLFQVALQLHIGDVSTAENRVRHFSLHSLGLSVSGAIGPVIIGYVVEHLGHRAAFVWLVGVATICCLALLVLRTRLPAVGARAAHAAPPRGAIRDLLGTGEMRMLFLVSATLSMAWDMHAFLIPIYGTRIGLSPSEIGWVLGVFATATFTIRLLMPALTGRLGEWQIIERALAVSAAAYLLYPWMQRFGLLCALGFALGLALGSAQPNVMSILHTAAPRGRAGEALGLRSTVLNASQAIWPSGIGALGTALGLSPLFFGMAAMLGVLAWVTRRRGFDV